MDLEAARAKYREERDRRIKFNGCEQYQSMSQQYSRYLEDPYEDADFARKPVEREVDTLVVGGGFGGLLSSARLAESYCDDFLVLEKGSDFGGTWYWNRYPGAACDTESYVYMPLLEETGYMPSSKYANATEIFEHCRRIANYYDLYSRALLQTTVTSMRWSESSLRWIVETDRADRIAARFVVLGAGGLQVPKLPGVSGIESVEGRSFHTSRWDYGYTGGDINGRLEKLHDKRVGVIGTGATAIQCIPHLAQGAKELVVFQRTPSAICRRDNRPTDMQWADSQKAGWQRHRMANFTSVISGLEVDVNLVDDGWTEVIGEVICAPKRKAAADERVDDPAAILELADLEAMDKIRANVDLVVRDPATAELLKPWYGVMCKRPCFHDEFLPVFNRDNVRIVDTSAHPIDAVTPTGVQVDTENIPLDCIVFATGFEVKADIVDRLGFEVIGTDGLSLSEKWENGAQTYHGFFVHKFPNLMLVSPTQSGQSANFTHMLDEQSRHVAYTIGRSLELAIGRFECTSEAEQTWVEEIVRSARGREHYMSECTPGYYNYEGEGFDLKRTRNGQYWKGPMAFVKSLEEWRAAGNMPGLDCTTFQDSAVKI